MKSLTTMRSSKIIIFSSLIFGAIYSGFVIPDVIGAELCIIQLDTIFESDDQKTSEHPKEFYEFLKECHQYMPERYSTWIPVYKDMAERGY